MVEEFFDEFQIVPRQVPTEISCDTTLCRETELSIRLLNKKNLLFNLGVHFIDKSPVNLALFGINSVLWA